MRSTHRLSVYDLIKTGLVLVLAVFLYTIFNPASQPESMARVTLPAYPGAEFEWKYDSSSRVLLNPQGVQLYTLTADGSHWQPVISASVRLQLPREYRLVQNSSGMWQILDASGSEITFWDSNSFQWRFDLAAVPATPTPGEVATPAVTATQSFTATFTPTQVATPTEHCPTQIVSRLKIGQTALVVENLRVHSTPEMIENVVFGIPRDQIVTVLDGPVCEPYMGRAYLWWEIQKDPGDTGWVVEATLNGSGYFLEPVD